MGKEKTTTTNNTTSNSQSTPTADPSMIELNKLQLEDYKANRAGAQQATTSGINLSNMLLTGQQLPGYLQSLPGGISEDVIGSTVNQSLTDMNAQLARSGAGTYMESGTSQAIGTRAATDMRNQAAQFNLQNLQQLLNLGVGGQAQPLQYGVSTTGQLGSRLQGLTSWNTQGESGGSTTQKSMNPFLKNLMTPSFSAGPFTFGGR